MVLVDVASPLNSCFTFEAVLQIFCYDLTVIVKGLQGTVHCGYICQTAVVTDVGSPVRGHFYWMWMRICVHQCVFCWSFLTFSCNILVLLCETCPRVKRLRSTKCLKMFLFLSCRFGRTVQTIPRNDSSSWSSSKTRNSSAPVIASFSATVG